MKEDVCIGPGKVRSGPRVIYLKRPAYIEIRDKDTGAITDSFKLSSWRAPREIMRAYHPMDVKAVAAVSGTLFDLKVLREASNVFLSTADRQNVERIGEQINHKGK